MAYLALVRHGESTWNAKGIWTGLTDVDLTDKGREEARKAGEVIKDIKFDMVFVTPLRRTVQTLEEMEKVWGTKLPQIIAPALTERDYGEYTGKNKWQIKEQLGEEKFLLLRRSWDSPVSGGESLKDVYTRAVPYYQNNILPELEKGKNILISAHGNSLRALVKYLDNILDQDIPSLEIATGEIYLYQVDQGGKIVNKEVLKS